MTLFIQVEMVKDYLTRQIKEKFSYVPTFQQDYAIKILAEYVTAPGSGAVMLLKGYAGTGKTSIAAALVKTLAAAGQSTCLLAPTGRAAKVFSGYAGSPAYTIHKKIYRQREFGTETRFEIDFNKTPRTVFLVDEASMISNTPAGYAMFGSGRLLDDLIRYVFSADGCKLILMGDTAQLPPVGEEESPALSKDYLTGYGLDITEVELTEVVRQQHESGILFNATRIRECLNGGRTALPKIRISGFDDIMPVGGAELPDLIERCYSHDGMDETKVVTRSNKRANIYNNGIRNRSLYRESELERGDIVMIAKNNYFWNRQDKDISFIANGDIARVMRVRGEEEVYGFRFAKATLQFPDYENAEIEARIILDTLHTEAPALTAEQNESLFRNVYDSYGDISIKKERLKRVKEDIYYNALQIKYAYAVTCHKAQGGQWRNIFIDQGAATQDSADKDYLRWLYTAMTRATGKLYLINFPGISLE